MSPHHSGTQLCPKAARTQLHPVSLHLALDPVSVGPHTGRLTAAPAHLGPLSQPPPNPAPITSCRKPQAPQPGMSGTSPAHQQTGTRSKDTGPITAQPGAPLCSPVGQASIKSPRALKPAAAWPGPLASDWQPLKKAGPSNQPDWGPTVPSRLPIAVSPQQQMGPHG